MAITRHEHVNQTGHKHVFQVDSEKGTAHLVLPSGNLQFSSTNIAPLLELPQVDLPADAPVVPEPELALPAAAEPVQLFSESAIDRETVLNALEIPTVEPIVARMKGKKADPPTETAQA